MFRNKILINTVEQTIRTFSFSCSQRAAWLIASSQANFCPKGFSSLLIYITTSTEQRLSQGSTLFFEEIQLQHKSLTFGIDSELYATSLH